MKRIRKAVIPAAGFGTRFLPATKATPKEMLPIVDKPTIQYIVEEAISSGIEDILIISGHAKRAIEDHFDSAPILEAELKAKGKTKLLEMVQETSEINVHYIRQKHMRGLGDAILCARAFIDNEPFAVLLGDDISTKHCHLTWSFFNAWFFNHVINFHQLFIDSWYACYNTIRRNLFFWHLLTT